LGSNVCIFQIWEKTVRGGNGFEENRKKEELVRER
jgi:hypothetical protein